MRLLIMITILAAVAGCQAVPTAQNYRWRCNDKPFEAGLCDQTTNWRIGDLMLQR